MTEEIRNNVLHAHEKGKKKYEAFHTERIVKQTLKLGKYIHRNYDLNQKQATENNKESDQRNEYD